ncbi:hypothetical protein A3860_21100 [Niastella vici]|uniref:Uncharacterized protein n=1 Tax=Niastella vici TaxID=1703345 RepID=A0A1V9G1T4_9BACT|nr:clostripain-related cysteine peptidase [Niastella vici]OQP64468.1 hypothetical protein A3860_21100 [Niastella vici]
MRVVVEQDQPVDWLVVFLILESLDITESVEEMFKEVKGIALKKTIKIYVLQDSIQHIKDPAGNRIDYRLKVHEFHYNEQQKETRLKPVQLEGVDTKDGFAWREALKRIRLINKPRVSALITWSHGAGIGILNPDMVTNNTKPLVTQKPNAFNIVRNFPNRKQRFIPEKFNCSTMTMAGDALIVNDPDNGDVQCHELQDLFISEIADGLDDMGLAPVFDIMVMGNCNTQIIDNCYNLNKIARYYLAPITVMQPNGYDFDRFIKTINGDIFTNEKLMKAGKPVPKILAKRPPIMKGKYYNTYFNSIARLFLNGYVTINERLAKSAAIVVNDLKEILALKPMINELCEYMVANKAKIYPAIDAILQEGTIVFSDKDFIDIVLLFDTIQQKVKNTGFNKIYSRLRKFLLKKITIEKHIGEELDANSFHCFSIYIPVSVNNVIAPTFCCQYFRHFANSQFVRETRWDNFVIDFTEWRLKRQ